MEEKTEVDGKMIKLERERKRERSEGRPDEATEQGGDIKRGISRDEKRARR